MRHALLSAVALIGFSLSVANGFAQGSGAGGAGSGGGSSGGSATTTNPANTTSAGTAAGPGTALTAQQWMQVRPLLLVPSAAPLATASFPVVVGTTIPVQTQLYAVPAGAVAVVPTIQGYQYVVVGNQVALVEPTTRRIIQVIQP